MPRINQSRWSVGNWLLTVPSVGGVFAALAAGDIAQRFAIRLGPSAHQRAVSLMAYGCSLATRLAGTRMRVEGRENARPGQNYIIVSNHQSVLDIAMTSWFLADLQPRYVSKREAARGIPGISYNLRRGGSANIDRKDPKQAHDAIETLARHIKNDGWSALIFPEGTRSKTGELKKFRVGGLRTLIANAPGIPVLPVTTSGGSKLFQHSMAPIVANCELVYRIHPEMMPPSPSEGPAFDAFLEKLQDTIREGLPPGDRVGE